MGNINHVVNILNSRIYLINIRKLQTGGKQLTQGKQVSSNPRCRCCGSNYKLFQNHSILAVFSRQMTTLCLLGVQILLGILCFVTSSNGKGGE